MNKKIIFYVGCVIALILPLIKSVHAFASGISLLMGIIMASFSLILVPKNLGKIEKLTLNSAVVFFGFGLSISKVVAVGSKGIFQTAISLIVVISIGLFLAKIFKMEKKLSQLIVFGTAICGGSAIAATSPVIEASDEDIALSTGIVFILNTVALFLFAFFINYFKLMPENQNIIETLAAKTNTSILFLSLVVFAPIAEELIFRYTIFGLNKNKFVGLIISSILFALVHVSSDFAISSFFIYFSMGMLFGLIYIKTESVEATIFAHFINNVLSFIELMF